MTLILRFLSSILQYATGTSSSIKIDRFRDTIGARWVFLSSIFVDVAYWSDMSLYEIMWCRILSYEHEGRISADTDHFFSSLNNWKTVVGFRCRDRCIDDHHTNQKRKASQFQSNRGQVSAGFHWSNQKNVLRKENTQSLDKSWFDQVAFEWTMKQWSNHLQSQLLRNVLNVCGLHSNGHVSVISAVKREKISASSGPVISSC